MEKEAAITVNKGSDKGFYEPSVGVSGGEVLYFLIIVLKKKQYTA